jgi:hypothetical protein
LLGALTQSYQNMKSPDERIHDLEVWQARIVSGGAVLATCILAFFSYEKWIDVPRRVQAQLDAKVGADTIQKITEAEKAAEQVMRLKNGNSFTVTLDQANTLPRSFGPGSASCFIPTNSDAPPIVSFAGAAALPDIKNIIVTTQQRNNKKGVYLRVDCLQALPPGWKCHLNVFQPGLAADFKPECQPFAASEVF